VRADVREFASMMNRLMENDPAFEEGLRVSPRENLHKLQVAVWELQRAAMSGKCAPVINAAVLVACRSLAVAASSIAKTPAGEGA
jgi:hypothetical protein